jgi:hypothetical protein
VTRRLSRCAARALARVGVAAATSALVVSALVPNIATRNVPAPAPEQVPSAIVLEFQR